MTTINLIILGLTGILMFVYTYLSGPKEIVSDEILKLLALLILMCIGIVVVNFLASLIVDGWFVKINKRQPSALLKLVISSFLYALCLMIILQSLGYNLTAFLTTSAILTAIIGFALQPALSTFFVGVGLSLDQPFHIGDRIIVQSQEGEVIAITWRATIIKNDDGVLIHIPNNIFSENLVQVISPKREIRKAVKFTVSAAIPPQQVIDTVSYAILNQPHLNIDLHQPVETKLVEYEISEAHLFLNYKILYYPLIYQDSDYYTDTELLSRVWYALHRKGLMPAQQLPQENNLLSLINNIEFFRAVDPETKIILIQKPQFLLFDANEEISKENLIPETMFIVVKGYIEIEQQLISDGEHSTFNVFSRLLKNNSPRVLEKNILENVSYQLAEFIGPSAFFLVQDFAPQVTSLYWLYEKLASLIHDLDEREKFLTYSPNAPVERLEIGDFFGEIPLFLGTSFLDIKMVTPTETKLLAITRQNILEVLQIKPELLDFLIKKFTRHLQENLVGTIQIPSSEILSLEQVKKRMQEIFLS